MSWASECRKIATECFAIAVQLVYGRSVTTITLETTQLPDSPLLATRVDAARILCISVTQVDRLRHKGALRFKRIGGKLVVPMSELEKYIERLPWEMDE